MPMCGFNGKMLDGITAFNEGLFEHGLLERSRAKAQPISTTLERELSDMGRFLAQTPRIRDPATRMLVEGLTLYAQGMYRMAQTGAPEDYVALSRDARMFFDGMDRAFYEQLEGMPNDMALLVDYINTQRMGR